MIEKPMNPYAAEDFRNAVNSIRKVSEEFKRIGEQMKANIEEGMMSFIDCDEMPEEYSGVIKLPYSPTGAWNDVFNILAVNGYRITATVEPPTETERKLDGVEPYIVIEYEEVE